ncbi:Oxidoreductase domain protein [Croceitalea dokdonensis DOKDO 023]|uniref:Oxidoreductase domain protein n=1 Tax=Croceitalea dokdonensis DOKDO 023 TaxID=1300341 RepID=A0A0N8H3G7_9FLAO|nr:Gfo/Idh/MocA family oxidoreductase [Croceitalea dokdonensis]KPM30524.1 Oxidoreductase domain protein [Croceitalea dokdonensis DOKDO 023]
MKKSNDKAPIRDRTNSRRSFLKTTALAAGLITIVPRHVLGKGFIAPSDKINLGYIGLGKQGGILANKFMTNTQAQIVAGAEVWTSKRRWFKQLVEGYYAEKRGVAGYNGIRTYLHYQELLEQDGLDAVVIATPDHWHAQQAIDAMKSGKDVFCEKPMTNTIKDGRDMVDALTKYDRVLQVGSMQRSWAKFIKANEIVKSGKLGEIKKVLVNVGDPYRTYDLPFQETPKGVDWNLWCGPAPLITYHDTIAPEVVKNYPAWRDFKEIGGGRLADWGTHMFDIAQWCLGMDRTGPVSFIPPKDPKATRGLRMFYENGIELVHEDFGRGWAVRFIGTDGSLDVSRSFLETTPSSILMPNGGDTKELFKDQGNHYQNWLDAIKTRQQPICDVEIGHRSASLCHIANIAYELNRPLQWNPNKEKFKGDKQANRMRKRKKRKF